MKNASLFLTGKKIKTFGNSMFPLLMNGDIVYFQKIHFKNININDIIIFKQKDRYITHRVIYKTYSYLITKGENNFKADPKVYKKDIIGKLEKVKRGNIEFNPELFYLMQSSAYINEILKVKKLFQKNNIPFVFLKGLPIHLHYEKNPPRRIYTDCDLLIHIDNFLTIKKYFHTLGYAISDNSISKKNRQTFSEISFFKKIKNVIVVFDIHVEPVFMMTQINVTKELYSQFLMEKMTQDFLKSKKNILIEKTQYPILKPSHLIVYLCLHFFHHNFKGAFRLSFIHAIITKENNNDMWKELVNFGKNYQLGNFIYPVLLLLNIYYKTFIPGEVFKLLKPDNYLQRKIGEYCVSDSFFNDESRLFGGINRLILIISLSPNSLHKKLLLFGNKEIWQLFITILGKIILTLFKEPKRSF